MPLRALLADVLPELAPASELDELGAEEQTGQKRRGARDEHLPRGVVGDRGDQPHWLSASTSASVTSSSPTPRDALMSTTSPGASSSGTSAAASPASATAYASPSKRSPMAAASGPTVTSTSTPTASARSPIST